MQDVIGLFPIGWRFFPEEFRPYVSDIQKKSEDEKD